MCAASYAHRLRKGYDYGTCGLNETTDSERSYQHKLNSLLKLIKGSNYIVFHTGAGISTSVGIRDFRGPNGIWTKEKEAERERKKNNINTTVAATATTNNNNNNTDNTNFHNTDEKSPIVKKRKNETNVKQEKKNTPDPSDQKSEIIVDHSDKMDIESGPTCLKTPNLSESHSNTGQSDDSIVQPTLVNSFNEAEKPSPKKKGRKKKTEKDLPPAKNEEATKLHLIGSEGESCASEKTKSTPTKKSKKSQEKNATPPKSPRGRAKKFVPEPVFNPKLIQPNKTAQEIAEEALAFESSVPSLTHMAVLGLVQKGLVKYVVSQNVDGLHLKSGLDQKYLSELHGNVFQEYCEKCGTAYIRNFDVGTVGFKYTGRKCEKTNCYGKLKDFLLDWDDCLPAEALKIAEDHCSKADLSISLGTSLRVEPACTLPFQNKAGKVVIVNLQETPFDQQAHLNVRTYSDKLMGDIMKGLQIPIPILSLHHTFLVCSKVEKMRGKYGKDSEGNPIFLQYISLVNADKTRCSYIKDISIHFEVDEKPFPQPALTQPDQDQQQEQPNSVEMHEQNNHFNEIMKEKVDSINVQMQEQTNSNVQMQEQTNSNVQMQEQTNFNVQMQEQTNFNVQMQEQVNFNEQMQEQTNSNEQMQEQVNFNEQMQEQTNSNAQMQEQVNFNEQMQEQTNFNVQMQEQTNSNEQMQEQVNFNEQMQEQTNFNEQMQEQTNFNEQMQEQINTNFKQQTNSTQQPQEQPNSHGQKTPKSTEQGQEQIIIYAEQIQEQSNRSEEIIIDQKNDYSSFQLLSQETHVPDSPSVPAGSLLNEPQPHTENTVQDQPQKSEASAISEPVVSEKALTRAKEKASTTPKAQKERAAKVPKEKTPKVPKEATPKLPKTPKTPKTPEKSSKQSENGSKTQTKRSTPSTKETTKFSKGKEAPKSPKGKETKSPKGKETKLPKGKETKFPKSKETIKSPKDKAKVEQPLFKSPKLDLTPKKERKQREPKEKKQDLPQVREFYGPPAEKLLQEVVLSDQPFRISVPKAFVFCSNVRVHVTVNFHRFIQQPSVQVPPFSLDQVVKLPVTIKQTEIDYNEKLKSL